ncbi:hypothetical protein QJS10_CPA06g01763 [Acorus calamus]|uniref:PRELI/MSF1 domain-containing protein n=1 Tax=Acorus calamus TaxID=4465 RepID=A0AAV9EIL0_ACOCL|nr:hypothetical protein QJS10_CPA06g01763 [Acorus calamus]
MVRAYTQEHVYHHPWDRVTSAAFRKFTDPSASTSLSHVLDVHTLSRSLNPSTGRLRTVRSITVHSPSLPFLLRRALGGRDSLTINCVETTVVDPVGRSMEVSVSNVGLRGLIEVEERSFYGPHPDDPGRRTAFRQETRIRCKPLSAIAAIAGKVESRCAERFLQNSQKGREVVERICGYLEAESTRSKSAIS